MLDLKAFRRKYDLTQVELADALSVPQSFISSIELGKSKIPYKLLENLKSIYGTKIDAYITIKESYDVDITDNISAKDLLELINKYEERLDKKDAQIDELTSMLRTEVEAIKSSLKNLEKQSVQQEDDVVCANAG